MSGRIKIGNRLIGSDSRPFIVAEISGNHNQSLERAIKIVEAAADAGAHAVKLQTYTADTMTINIDKGSFLISDSGSLWKGKTLYELYRQAYTPWEWHEPIFKRCSELGLIAFSTPFDESSVDFLESLSVPAYKIASFENNHLPLIRKVAETGKPLMISTGMATLAELYETVNTAIELDCRDIILLKCTSAYPATPENANLLTIPHLKQLFNTEVGLSDHTLGVGVSIASVALGASVIEKHFTLLRSDGGVDSAFSMEPWEMKILVHETYKAWQSLGKVSYEATENEQASTVYRRSIYIVKDIKRGEKFDTKNIRVIRPGDGIAPKYIDILLGKRASRDIPKGIPMNWKFVE
jgi:N-acetylneuraminate synthase